MVQMGHAVEPGTSNAIPTALVEYRRQLVPVSDLNCPDLEPTTITKWVATRDDDGIPYQ